VGYYIGTDVGGTFTDLWVTDSDGRTLVFKAPTTEDVLGGVIDAMTLAAEAYGLSFGRFCAAIERFGHGTTVGLNALLTGRAAKTAVITTRGFGDTLEIGRLRRQTSGLNELEMTDAYKRNRFRPLVPRNLVLEVDERIDADGRVITPLDEARARHDIAALRERGVEAVAVCTLWAIRNPIHERRLGEIVREELPDAFVSLAHQLAPNVGEYARMSTTAANAALGPLAGHYLSRLEATLHEAGMRVPVLMMTCNGGVLPAPVLSDRPAVALFSGPAAGVIGSAAIGAPIGLRNILVSDIGGTSFDVGVIVEGEPVMRSEITVAGADIRVRSIDVDSIGAGGGSIASVHFGELRVGPASAGANPGPACYGRGGVEPTATDADLVLGVLDPHNFLGGRMALDTELARRAIADKVATPLGIGLVDAAWAIRQVLDSRMADLLRRMTVERGHDPRDFTLFANGGAGPSHAWMLAAELGLDSFVVPAAATAASAYGTANSDLAFTTERPTYCRIPPGKGPTPQQLDAISTGLAGAARDASEHLAKATAGGKIEIARLVSMRFRGQMNHLDVDLASDGFDRAAFDRATQDFQHQYETRFGRGAAFANAGYEILSVRTTAIGSLPPPGSTARGETLVSSGTRPVVFTDPKIAVDTAIYRTGFPAPGSEVAGPAIVEFPGQSVVVPPGATARADDFGNLHVRLAP
jgi:N-methylhydantoinase A